MTSTSFLPLPSSGASPEAIGSAERLCRQKGNCLETRNLDGALGFNWGGADRCDARDPKCRTNGRLEDGVSGEVVDMSVPVYKSATFKTVTLIVTIDRSPSTLKLGLFNDCDPKLIKQFLDISTDGLSTTSKLLFEEGYGETSSPVLLETGELTEVDAKSQLLTFGVKSQGQSYAKKFNMSKPPEEYVPQERPRPLERPSERPSERVPGGSDEIKERVGKGLVYVSELGLGYLNNPTTPDDAAFSSLFEISGWGPFKPGKELVPIGQVVGEESMETLYRLCNLPVNKRIKGIVGGSNGRPLVNVRIEDVKVE